MKPSKDNPLTSYIRHAITLILMKITGDHLPMEGLPMAAEYAADAVVLALYWAVVKYGYSFCRNRILPWLDRVSGISPTNDKNEP